MHRRRNLGQYCGRILVGLLIGLIAVGLTGWSIGVLYYHGPGDSLQRRLCALACGLAILCAVLCLPNRRRTLAGCLLVWGVLIAWWGTITPSHDRHWQPDVAILPYATVDGDRVTLHNIRNFAYRTATDFTPRYYDKTFDLGQLTAGDLLSSYWQGDAIAHLFVSFSFGGQDFVAVSIEARKEQHEDYASLQGFFKQYELIYVVADERDVIRLRTTYRQPQEEVYLYRLRLPPAYLRRLFMEYVREINALAAHPAFYNTLTTNCTTSILFHTRAAGGTAPYNWKVLLSGYAPRYAYELGRLDTSLPFAELRQRSHINARAQAAHEAPDFSQRIRAGLPQPAVLHN